MKPIYFPFTYISDAAAEALAACFGQFVVYQPLSDKVPVQIQTWANKGIVDVRVPVVENDKELEAAAKNYLDWANLHVGRSGKKVAAFKNLMDSAPLPCNFSPSQIAVDIKKRTQRGLNAKASDPVLAARIFLYFAQEFDRQSQEVDHDFKRCSQKELDLMRELKMEEDSLAGEYRKEEIQMPDVSTDYMIMDRLEAWTRILLKDPEASGLYVTNSPAVVDHVLDRAQSAEKLFNFESIPLDGPTAAELDSWRHKLVSILAQTVKNKRPVPSDGLFDMPASTPAVKTVSLSVYLLPDQPPSVLFPRCVEIKRQADDNVYHADKIKNTLIGLVEF